MKVCRLHLEKKYALTFILRPFCREPLFVLHFVGKRHNFSTVESICNKVTEAQVIPTREFIIMPHYWILLYIFCP